MAYFDSSNSSTALPVIIPSTTPFRLCPLLDSIAQCKLVQMNIVHYENIIITSLIISVAAIAVNAVEIGLIWKQQQRTRTEYILLSLAVADLMSAASMTLNKLSELYMIPHEGFAYILYAAFAMISTSILHLLLMTLDRVVTVVAPFWHKVHVTLKRTGIALSIIWLNMVVSYISSVILFESKSISFMTGVRIYLEMASIVFFLMSIMMFISYIIIVRKAKSSISKSSSIQHDSSRKGKERRLIITTCCILGICFICYLPYTIVVWYSIIWVFRFQICVCFATLLNPLVYFFSYQCLKKFTKQRTPEVQRLTKQKNNEIQTTETDVKKQSIRHGQYK